MKFKGLLKVLMKFKGEVRKMYSQIKRVTIYPGPSKTDIEIKQKKRYFRRIKSFSFGTG